MDIPASHPSAISLDNGRLILNEKVHSKASILVRFGGEMSIGKCTGIGYGTEIRCEEKVDIGNYCLFSYNVCIYDTNTHSTNYLERRALIDRGYPFGAHEEKKPDTSSVKIGNDVWIGKEATVLKGVTVGDRCIIGIRTVVPSGSYKDRCKIVAPKPYIID